MNESPHDQQVTATFHHSFSETDVIMRSEPDHRQRTAERAPSLTSFNYSTVIYVDRLFEHISWYVWRQCAEKKRLSANQIQPVTADDTDLQHIFTKHFSDFFTTRRFWKHFSLGQCKDLCFIHVSFNSVTSDQLLLTHAVKYTQSSCCRFPFRQTSRSNNLLLLPNWKAVCHMIWNNWESVRPTQRTSRKKNTWLLVVESKFSFQRLPLMSVGLQM